MNRQPFVLDVALEQFQRMGAPTAIVPVACGDQPGTFYATYHGDDEWMALAHRPEHQAELAIAMCKRAYADARRHSCDRRT